MAWTLVTGGAKRLGACLARALAESGNDVVIQYRHSIKEAEEVAEQCSNYGVRSAVLQGDFSDPEKTEDFISRYLREFPDTKNIINNVGNYLIRSALQTAAEEWTELFQINLHAPFALIRSLSPSLINRKGNIINFGISGIHSGHTGTHAAAYRITKQSLWALTRSLAAEMAGHGVRVNMISPGYLDNAVDLPPASKLPMGRPAYCEEIARVVTFLLDEKSNYITGQNIEVAGGVGLT